MFRSVGTEEDLSCLVAYGRDSFKELVSNVIKTRRQQMPVDLASPTSVSEAAEEIIVHIQQHMPKKGGRLVLPPRLYVAEEMRLYAGLHGKRETYGIELSSEDFMREYARAHKRKRALTRIIVRCLMGPAGQDNHMLDCEELHRRLASEVPMTSHISVDDFAQLLRGAVNRREIVQMPTSSIRMFLQVYGALPVAQKIGMSLKCFRDSQKGYLALIIEVGPGGPHKSFRMQAQPAGFDLPVFQSSSVTRLTTFAESVAICLR